VQHSEDFLPFLAYAPRPEQSTSVDLQDWANRHGLLASSHMRRIFTTTYVGQFADLAYRWADAPGRELASCWCLWTLLTDELFEARVKGGVLGRVPGDGANPEADLVLVSQVADETDLALASALKDLLYRSCTGQPDAWAKPFTAHVAEFIRSCHLEALHRVDGVKVSMAEFIALRRGSFATAMFLDLVEPLTGSALPPGEPYESLRAGMRECAADLGGWCNDLISFRRESGAEDENNIVLRLADGARTDCAIDTATRGAREMILERAWKFLELKAELTPALRAAGSSPAVASRALCWAHAVETLVSGSLSFQLISTRWSAS
jgi:Terpene synthase family 2, C-terminal metal binding